MYLPRLDTRMFIVYTVNRKHSKQEEPLRTTRLEVARLSPLLNSVAFTRVKKTLAPRMNVTCSSCYCTYG